MGKATPDPVKRKAVIWRAVRTMIRRYGADWREHLDRDSSERVDEMLAPLGSIEDWASRALDEAEDARIVGDAEKELDRIYLLGEILSSGGVTFQ